MLSHLVVPFSNFMATHYIHCIGWVEDEEDQDCLSSDAAQVLYGGHPLRCALTGVLVFWQKIYSYHQSSSDGDQSVW